MQRLALARPDIWISALLFAIGLVIASFAVSVLVTYHNGPQILQIAGLDRLQYDTAWVIVLCGASLLTYATGLRAAGRLCATVVFLIGSLRIAGYVFPQVVGVHPILANPWLRFGAGDYNAIGVLTALVALVLAIALAFLVPGSQRRPWRTVSLGLLASTALALSLLIAFGAWSGSSIASQSLQLEGDERTSSLVFILLSTTLLLYTLMGGEHERRTLGRFAPVIVGIAVFICTLVVWRAALNQETRYVRHGTELTASGARGAIERDLRNRIDVVERLADRMSIHPFNADVWQREGATILKDVGELRSIAWSGPDYTIKWVAPYNSAPIGFNILSDPARRGAAQLAATSRKTTLSPFINLLIGGRGVVVYVPVYQGDEFRGLVSSVLGDQWLKSLIDGRFSNHHFELLEDAQVQLTAPAETPRASEDWAQELPVAVNNVRWVLRVTPTEDFVARGRSPLPAAVLAIGALLSTLLGLATYLFQAARRRARALGLANAQLSQDVARRQHAEQRLRESEQRTQLIINSVKDCAIYMLDTEGKVASWNAGAHALYGYPPGEIMGRHFSVLYPPDRKVPAEDELVVATRRGWFEEECWHLRKDETRFCADDIISAIRDEQTHLRGFAVVTRDATPRIELREQTERARDHYFSLFSSFPNLVWRSDPSGACDYLNQAWLDYTGLAMDDQRGDRWLDAMHPDDRKAWNDNFGRMLPARQSFEQEFRLRRADGSYGSMICTARPYHDIHGTFAGFLCSCYDNTQRRAAEVALKESEERYQRMTTNVPGMVFKLERGTDLMRKFLYVSQGSLAVTGVEPAAICADAEKFFGLLSSADRGNLLATLEDSAERQTTWTWAGRLQAAHEATEKWITIRAKSRRGDGGSTIWDGVVFDDTQSRLAQLELERSREELRSLSRHLQTVREEEKARIAREVHDELGSTLTGLRIDLDWLIDHQSSAPAGAAEKYTGMLSLLESAVTATRKIVTDLRPSILDDLGLSSAMRWQIGEYRKQSAMRFELRSPEPDLVIDRAQALVLFRIFQETITNVTRYAKATVVDIDLTQTPVAYIMQIRDNGVGIADNDMRKQTSHGIRGMRERAEQLGGTLSISGEAGKGTTVVVTLPRDATS